MPGLASVAAYAVYRLNILGWLANDDLLEVDGEAGNYGELGRYPAAALLT